MFKDITTALKDKQGLNLIIKDFTEKYENQDIDFVLEDARGFIYSVQQ